MLSLSRLMTLRYLQTRIVADNHIVVIYPGGVALTCGGVLSAREKGEPATRRSQVARPWPGIAEDVRRRVQAAIDTAGEFRTAGDGAVFVCR